MRDTFYLCLIIAVLSIYAWKEFRPRHLEAAFIPSSQVASTDPDPCLNKERCVLVQVAPWCPSCHEARGLILGLRDRWKASSHIGFKIVLAGDTQVKLRAEAESLGANTYLDYKREFSRETGETGFPDWVVLNEDKKVIAHFEGYVVAEDPAMAQQGLIRKLNLEKFDS
jgi:hypothetical protein